MASRAIGADADACPIMNNVMQSADTHVVGKERQAMLGAAAMTNDALCTVIQESHSHFVTTNYQGAG